MENSFEKGYAIVLEDADCGSPENLSRLTWGEKIT